MKNLLSFTLAMFISVSLYSQSMIYGRILQKESGTPLGSVNVMLQSKDGKMLLCYHVTEDDGKYELEYKSDSDSLMILVTGFNIKEERRRIANRPAEIDFHVISSENMIKEITVRAPAVSRRHDTLNYAVSKYIDHTDRSIGDILKKLPGISVAKSGEIKYNGQAINNFYIEGLDMLKGRYGIATNNIRAEDIASVEVLENHQSIKALHGLSDSEKAAINLRLKESAKGIWSGTLQAGAGYRPVIWNAEATMMYFSRKFQSINTYKANNAGDDVASEITLFYGGAGVTSSTLGIHTPSIPDKLDNSRYLFNNIHTVSLNSLVKVGKEMNLVANASYMYDRQEAEGNSTTTYFLPEDMPLTITERISAAKRNNRANVALRLDSNTEKHYLTEELSFGGKWDTGSGIVATGEETVRQNLETPEITLNNRFSTIRRWEQWSMNIMSDTDYGTGSSALQVFPMIYDGIFNAPEDFKNAEQTLSGRRFMTNNNVSASFNTGRWYFSMNAGLNAKVETMESSLAAMDGTGKVQPADDKMKNSILWRRFDISAGPSIRYSYAGFSFNMNLPMDYMKMYSDDRIRNTRTRKDKLMLRPNVSVKANLTHSLKFSANASYGEEFGNLYDSYGGFIMTDYRAISSKSGEPRSDKRMFCSANISYGNAVIALFGSLNVNYWNSEKNLTYGTRYEGHMSIIEAVETANRSEGYNLRGNIEKRIDPISTTIGFSGGYSKSWGDVLRQDVMLPSKSERITAGTEISTGFTRAVILRYTAEYSRRKNFISGESRTPVDAMQQELSMDFVIKRKFICSAGGEHYLNTSIEGPDRNVFFLDASVSYRGKRTEYILEGRNLLNNDTFSTILQSDITDFRQVYNLRPVSVMFTVKFSF